MTTSAPGLSPLHTRSAYSLRRGPTPLEHLVEVAATRGHEAMALTDVNGLHGAVFFDEMARQHDIHPVIGVHLVDPLPDEGRRRDRPDEAVVLAADDGGFARLCELVSRRRADPTFRLAEALGTDPGGLVVLCRDPELLGRLAPVLGPDRLFAEVVRPGSVGRERRLSEAARDHGIRPVASTDVCFADPGEVTAHRTLLAIGAGTTVARLDEERSPGGPRPRPARAERWLRPPGEAAELFRDRPGAVRRARAIARSCEVSLDRASRGEWIFPPYDRLPPGETAASHLRTLARRGLEERYEGDPPGGARPRLERELRVIEELGFPGYFLVVREITRWARERGHPIAGRGSGASSLVAHVLGLTNVCPLRFSIPFERFLHRARRDPPDLDIDFCWRIRDEILAHLFRRHGRERCAMVSSHIAFRPRSAFREAARASGLSREQVSAVKRLLPPELDRDLGTRIPDRVLRRLPVDEGLVRTILRRARAIVDRPSHLSVHPGGVVVCPGPVRRHAPVEPAAKTLPGLGPEGGEGPVPILQWEKDQTEAAGLIKIDLLGNRALSTTREAVAWAGRLDGATVDVERLPPTDPATVDLLRRGDTLGANQLESPAMRHLLRMMRPSGADDVMRALALIRPGAAGRGMKERFVRRHRGLEEWTPPHPALADCLGATHGIMLYEDDALEVAATLAGLDRTEADRFRKRIQKVSTDAERRALSEAFLGRCRDRGIPEEVCRDLWVQMAKFNAYAFCKGHAASYGVLAWAAAWLKAHHPVAFWVGALNNNQGLYPKRVYLAEARRRGIPTRLPCVNRSGREFTAETLDGRPPDGATRGRAIRVGLGRIRNLPSATVEAILAERERGGPFSSLLDFQRRLSGVGPADVEALVRCGAFDFTGSPRPHLLLESVVGRPVARSLGRGELLFDEATIAGEGGLSGADLDPYPEAERRIHERELLDGLSPRAHVLELLRPGLTLPDGLCSSTELGRRVGERVVCLGVLDTLRRIETRGGRNMEFLTLEDEAGVFEATLFPDVARRLGDRVRDEGPWLVGGTVEDHLGAVTLRAERIARARRRDGEGGPRRVPTPSAGRTRRRPGPDRTSPRREATP